VGRKRPAQATGPIVCANDRDRVLCVNRANADDRYGKQNCRRRDKNSWAYIFMFTFKHSSPEFIRGSSQDFSELEKSGSMSWGELIRE